jgi:hypothetical protein
MKEVGSFVTMVLNTIDDDVQFLGSNEFIQCNMFVGSVVFQKKTQNYEVFSRENVLKRIKEN